MQSHVALGKIVIFGYTGHRLLYDRNVEMVIVVYTWLYFATVNLTALTAVKGNLSECQSGARAQAVMYQRLHYSNWNVDK